MHFERGREYGRAIRYLQLAGDNANQRGANAEAVSHLTKRLGLFKTFPNTPSHVQQELTLQLTLGALLTATKGFASPEVEFAYRRAQALCEQSGDQMQVFTALRSLALCYTMRLEHQSARTLADQLFSIAQEAP